MSDTPSTIVIAGGGTAGWMAAATLARFSDRRIVLIESDAIGTIGVGEATIPQIRLFNAALGFDEAEFLRETKGSFKLGIEFAGWNGDGSSYLHAFGSVGHGAGALPFHHYWLRGQRLGLAAPIGHYSLNDRAARANRMHQWHRQPDRQAPNMPWAYHFDAALYAAYLRRYSEARNVSRIEGRILDVRRDGESGDIASLTLDGDREVAGDLFLDCTGFGSLLLGEQLGNEFRDWSEWLPCDRAIAVPCEAKGDFTPYTRATARKAGWQWRIPLQHRVGNGYVYCSAFLSDDEAAATLLANLDAEPIGDPRQLRFSTGMRYEQWSHNCLALGLAAGFMEPLESTSIHLVQSSIARFLQMLPAGRPVQAMRDAFNAQARFEWTRIRDFLILHYRANGRTGDPFWDRCRAMALPDTLNAKIDQFRATGYIHREHEELFTEAGWLQVMIGQGIMPESHNPLADTLPEAELRAMLVGIVDRHRQTVLQMPSHAEFLRGHILPRPQNVSTRIAR